MTSDELVDGTRIDYIGASESPDDESLGKLRQALVSLPRIQEAWLVGFRVTSPDGSVTDQSEIALIFDQPYMPDELSLDGFSSLISALKLATGWGNWRGIDRLALAHLWGDTAAKIYERPKPHE